jgi:hypothetical protein
MSKSNHPDLERPLLSHDEEAVIEAIPVVESAEVVLVPVQQQDDDETEEVATLQHSSSASPPRTNIIRRSTSRRGQWKDGIFNCCTHGCCHPSLVYPLCCPLSKSILASPQQFLVVQNNMLVTRSIFIPTL